MERKEMPAISATNLVTPSGVRFLGRFAHLAVILNLLLGKPADTRDIVHDLQYNPLQQILQITDHEHRLIVIDLSRNYYLLRSITKYSSSSSRILFLYLLESFLNPRTSFSSDLDSSSRSLAFRRRCMFTPVSMSLAAP